MCSQLEDPESSPRQDMPDRPLVGGHPHPGEVHPHHAAHAPRLQDGAIDESLELNRGRAGAQMHERRIARGDDAVRRMLAQPREHGVGVFCVDGPVRLADARAMYSP